MRRVGTIARTLIVAVVVGASPGMALGGPVPWTFTDVTAAAGVSYAAGWQVPLVAPDGSFDEPRHIAAGAAAADVDGDGWLDLYVTRGDIGRNLLFRNRGDGTFEDVSSVSGAALDPGAYAGPVFADLDGDGVRDLFVGAVRATSPRLLRGRGNGTFEDVTARWGLGGLPQTFSASFADVDRDGDLDLALAHWAVPIVPGDSTQTLWRNDGNGFVDVSTSAGITPVIAGDPPALLDLSFTPIFTDLDENGWPDLLIAGDFGTSLVLANTGAGTFVDRTDRSVVTDENGMGAAVGDFDGDGRPDWFVTSIWDPDGIAEDNWGVTGNRLYRGLGDGTFADVTDAAGVRHGYWGWGAVAADLENDGDLDLVHVNGFGRSAEEPNTIEFWDDPTRVFVNDGSGSFAEASLALGIDDRALGRAIVAFDYDRDGDVDLFVANGSQPGRLFRNDGAGENGWLGVRLRGQPPNTDGIGARVTVETSARTQVREVRAGNNFESSDPSEALFGLGEAHSVERLHVRWPGGDETVLFDVAADRLIEVTQPANRCGDGVQHAGWPYFEPCDGGPCCREGCERRPDADVDGICDVVDACPDVPDPEQQDTDADGLGDACDPCSAPTSVLTRTTWRRSARRIMLRASVVDAAGRAPVWSARGTGIRVLAEAPDRTGPRVDVLAAPEAPWRIRGARAVLDVGDWQLRVRRRKAALVVDLRTRAADTTVPAVDESGLRIVVVTTPPSPREDGCAERVLDPPHCRVRSGGRYRCRAP